MSVEGHEKPLSRMEKLQYLFLMLNSMTTVTEVMKEWSGHLARRAKSNPMDPELGRWLEFLEKFYSKIEMDELLGMLAKELTHEVMRPHERQEVIDNIFKDATKGKKDLGGKADGGGKEDKETDK